MRTPSNAYPLSPFPVRWRRACCPAPAAYEPSPRNTVVSFAPMARTQCSVGGGAGPQECCAAVPIDEVTFDLIDSRMVGREAVAAGDAAPTTCPLSIFACGPFPRIYNPEFATSAAAAKPMAAAKGKGHRSTDRPIVFHSRIKSSGYGKKPPEFWVKAKKKTAITRRGPSPCLCLWFSPLLCLCVPGRLLITRCFAAEGRRGGDKG